MRKNFLTLLTVVSVGYYCYAPFSEASELSNRSLRITVKYEPITGYQIVLTNYSNEFLCIDQSMFDTKRGNIVLLDDKNKSVDLISSAEPAPDIAFGFDFNQAYYFVRPKKVRKIYFDFQNFRTTKSKYSYEISFPYYRCSDIIDKARINGKKSISAFVARATGVVLLTPHD